MSKIRYIQEEMKFLQSLKELTEAYEEIAVVRMKKIRDSILSARRFEEALGDIFTDVKQTYKRKVEKLMQQKKGFFGKKERKLAILITPNNKLYGGLVEKVFKEFFQKLPEYNEILVIGKVGFTLFKQTNKNLKTKALFFKDFNLSREDILTIVKKISEFEKIDVYHPKFESLISQKVEITNISGDRPKPLLKEEKEGKKMGFLVEPSIEEVFTFFKTQVLASLFKGSLGESELALLAARIKAMEQALERIEEKLEKMHNRFLREKRLEKDKKQLEQLAGISLWQAEF